MFGSNFGFSSGGLGSNTFITGANNGLSVFGGNIVQLGGSLIKTTTIDQNNFAFNIVNGLNNQLTILVNGNIGIGTNSPNAKLQVLGVDSVNFVNQRLEPVVGVKEDTLGETITTSDATPSTLKTIAIPTDTVLLIEAYITCRKTAGSGVGVIGDGNGYVINVKAKNVGGVITIGFIQNSFTSEDISVLDCTFIVSGTNILLQVTGAINDNVTWNTITKTYNV